MILPKLDEAIVLNDPVKIAEALNDDQTRNALNFWDHVYLDGELGWPMFGILLLGGGTLGEIDRAVATLVALGKIGELKRLIEDLNDKGVRPDSVVLRGAAHVGVEELLAILADKGRINDLEARGLSDKEIYEVLRACRIFSEFWNGRPGKNDIVSKP